MTINLQIINQKFYDEAMTFLAGQVEAKLRTIARQSLRTNLSKAELKKTMLNDLVNIIEQRDVLNQSVVAELKPRYNKIGE